jgi:hypothetical protein
MVSVELEAQVRALTHLVTVLIRRIHDTDETWCNDLLAQLKTERTPLHPAPLSKAYDHAIGIIQRAIGTDTAGTNK